jgi:hypothetical protein
MWELPNILFSVKGTIVEEDSVVVGTANAPRAKNRQTRERRRLAIVNEGILTKKGWGPEGKERMRWRMEFAQTLRYPL